jgi:hypothetical protein
VFEKDADATSLEWKIELGSAHVQLFDRLFQSVFEKLVHLENLTAGNDSGRLGVVMRPSIDAYSLHTPGETTSDFYEVEIRYRLDFHSPAGDLIRHWSYAGRGKCRAALFSNDESVRKATVAAMRDAAAWLVVELTQYPDFHALLHAQQNDPENAVDDQDS